MGRVRENARAARPISFGFALGLRVEMRGCIWLVECLCVCVVNRCLSRSAHNDPLGASNIKSRVELKLD